MWSNSSMNFFLLEKTIVSNIQEAHSRSLDVSNVKCIGQCKYAWNQALLVLNIWKSNMLVQLKQKTLHTIYWSTMFMTFMCTPDIFGDIPKWESQPSAASMTVMFRI